MNLIVLFRLQDNLKNLTALGNGKFKHMFAKHYEAIYSKEMAAVLLLRL